MSLNDTTPRSGLAPGIAVGLLATVVGAAAYAALVWATGYEIGIAAIGIGVIVGLAIMAVKPSSGVLPVLAGLFALIGCALGQVGGLTALAVSQAAERSVTLGYVETATSVAENFGAYIGEDPKILLFWALSAAAGYSFVSKRTKGSDAEARPAETTGAIGAKAEGAPAPGVPQAEQPAASVPDQDGGQRPGA
ncbi:hypothetical protein [Spongiactinospora sp. TRM90649]|uniref:hypothetical protein n=1 Tax=Spongiactinospora sp. TRM90649 TaxID=3031114 RepID=UPI0023F6247F|nr:hypothetical protein [Spongiactinospora sp. TRM90649]MDF5753691.1 hypothetical protein [Spongiactinospora sp. TRM90649]